ncbi:MAG: potassium channel protein [Proteobacteria bacterium]|nr:MAG: potassium channel protein [Pseudomonadota bacterium]
MSFKHKIAKFLNWAGRSVPEASVNDQLYEQLKPFRFPLIAIVLMTMIGGLGYVAIDGFSLMDGIYQASITFTTVGFTEVDKISDAGRIFTITLIVVGFIVFSFSIGILIESLKTGDLVRLIKERKMLYKIARLKRHYVICYHNEFTIQLAEHFRESHVPFVVVDPSDNILELAQIHRYPYVLQEDPHTEIALLKSHFSSARGMITLSKNIADNIAQIASARLFEKELGRSAYFIMANADKQSDVEKLKKLGADIVVSPSELVAQRMSMVSLRPDMQNVFEKILYRRDTPISLEQVEIPDYSWMRFKKLKEAHLRDIASVSIVGIKDSKGKFFPMPKGDTLIGTGYSLLIIGTNEGIQDSKRIIRQRNKPEELKYV